MAYSKIEVLVARSQEQFEKLGPDFGTEEDTVKKAKARAKYYLTKEYQAVAESSERYGYAQVIADGQCIYDFHA